MRCAAVLLCLSITCPLLAADADHKVVVAHRGASGYLPEHTLEAKALAFAQGADYLEQDVVMTSDDQLVVLHDLTLERMTDVATLYPGRARADGSFYVIDFTLAELRKLHVSEGKRMQDGKEVPSFPGRFPINSGNFSIHTLQEELQLVAGLSQSTGRLAGIYPELKSPWFHHQHNKDIATAVLTVLREYGYDSEDDAVYVQSFDYNELQRVHDEVMPALGIKLKLVQLIAENEWQETFEQDAQGQWVNYRYDWMHTEAGLQKLATIAAGVGPSYTMLVSAEGSGKPSIAPFTGWAHAVGLQIHPYTFRSDAGQLPAWATSFDELLQFFLFDVGVDGVFTDFPDKAVRFLQQH